jgi:hypothetical protein
VVCLGYKAPAKVDPRLLDPKVLFQEVAEAPKVGCKRVQMGLDWTSETVAIRSAIKCYNQESHDGACDCIWAVDLDATTFRVLNCLCWMTCVPALTVLLRPAGDGS